MNAVVQRKPIWQEIVEECRHERHHGREVDHVSHVDDEDACRYIQECQADGADGLVQTMAEAMTDIDGRDLRDLEQIIVRVMNRGDSVPMTDAVRLIELLQNAFTNRVRYSLAKRIEREGL